MTHYKGVGFKRLTGKARHIMGKSLVIVESPAKAKPSTNTLGNDFIVQVERRPCA